MGDETPIKEQSAPVIPFADVEVLRNVLDGIFIVSTTAMNKPEPGFVQFQGRPAGDGDIFDEVNGRFNPLGYTPHIKKGYGTLTAIIAEPVIYESAPSNYLVNLLLFIITIFSTLYIGALYAESNAEYSLSFTWLLQGWPYSLSLLTILGAHELGHYFAARYHKVPVTLPYFIPLPTPYSLLGTMGAFIKIKAPFKNRRVMLDVGAAGPLAGMVFAIPILYYGLATSPVLPLPSSTYLAEGNSIIYLLMKYLVHGQILPANGMDVSLNQIAWAGWVGLLVTGLNLLPLGQLDGGHVAFVLFGKKARSFFWPVIISLAAIILLTQTYTWTLWIMMLFFLGRQHAEPLDMVTPLDHPRLWIAIGTLLLFALVFAPIPFQIITP